MKKSFANRLILNFTFVVTLGFLAVYFLFNSLMDGHIYAEAEAELDREILTVSESTIPVAEFTDHTGERVEIILGTQVRTHQPILNVDTIIIDHDGMILLPDQRDLSETEIVKIETLSSFFVDNQQLFEASDDMIMTTHHDHTFYMRATPHYIAPTGLFFFEPVPVFVLMYTDITPATHLKNSMNQVLLVLLAISGSLTLGISIMLSTSFKKSIKRLSIHADIIGQGDFDEKIEGFNYSEFNHLGHNMNNMASMLKTYESNQKHFFQNASHELRTPLMSIQGYAEGLQSGVFESKNATDIILEESKKMTELINDILYLSKLTESENAQLNLASFPINTLLTVASERVKIIAKKANKQLVTTFSTDIEINTDKDKLERAIMNILVNAIRYAKNTIQINCSVINNQLTIAITNDGPMIDENDLPYLFDRFYKGRSGNTGLGLAITKDIVTRLGGTVKARNLEFGVEFVIRLPF